MGWEEQRTQDVGKVDWRVRDLSAQSEAQRAQGMSALDLRIRHRADMRVRDLVTQLDSQCARDKSEVDLCIIAMTMRFEEQRAQAQLEGQSMMNAYMVTQCSQGA